MLECRNVGKKYGGKTAVDDVTMCVEDGRLVALLGPNGSGKTTLMKMVAGLVKPTSGQIRFDHAPIGVETKRHVAYMPTETYFYNYMTALDAGKYYRDFFQDFDFARYEEMLRQEKLEAKQKIRSMSSGMMAKLKLALAFSRNSRLVMLDEPLNGIDIIARERTLGLIRENHTDGRTLIVSSHLVDELEDMIDDAIFMKDGKIVRMGDAKAMRSESGMSIVDMYMQIYGEGGAKADA